MVKIIAGNWKMNGLKSSVAQIEKMSAGIKELDNTKFKMVICPPFTLITDAISASEDSELSIGGQDCHAQTNGAYTSNISAEMLEETGCEFVIVGHSERRQYEKDTNEMIAAKAVAAMANNLTPMICMGETESEYENGSTLDVIEEQFTKSMPAGATVDNIIVAYEPVWAIGTGKVATTDDVAKVHAHIKKVSEKVLGNADVKILYGGSVKPTNANEIMSLKDVDGVLVGGASLKAEDFLGIASAIC